MDKYLQFWKPRHTWIVVAISCFTLAAIPTRSHSWGMILCNIFLYTESAVTAIVSIYLSDYEYQSNRKADYIRLLGQRR